MVVYENEFFTLTANNDNALFITVSKIGYELRQFNSIIIDLPIIQLTNFNNLKNAISMITSEPIHIGSIRPRVEVILSSDGLEASIKLNISAQEMTENRINISSEIIDALNSRGITEGLEQDIFTKPIAVQNETPVAKGVPPINGEDAKITYYTPSNKKPIIKEDGSINYYELHLIDNVQKGEWVGEKIPATLGTPGKTVDGTLIPPRKGKDLLLKYDRKTIGEFIEGDKIVLRALIDGAIKFDKGKIKIDTHLIIDGDVDYNTGNIDFEGYITIQGSVNDTFSVTAKNDISINGPIGIGAVGKILSKEGSIYIKGGVFGKGIAQIEAANNVYIKYCNDCKITAGEDINIGFYALDSELNAKDINLNPVSGKIIGGTINAEIKVTASMIGNRSEKKTQIYVKGFDRLAIKAEYEKVLLNYKYFLEDINRVKRQLEVYENLMSGAEYANMEEYNDYRKKFDYIMNELKILDEYRKKLEKILGTQGEGAIDVTKAAYPETYIEIKNLSKRINSVVKGTFYFSDRELHHE